MIQEAVRNWLPLTAAFLLSLLALSCQRSNSPARAQSTPPSSPAGSGTARPAAQTAAVAPTATPSGLLPAVSPAGQGQRGGSPGGLTLTRPGEASGPAPQPRPLSSAAALMALGRGSRLLPEDFKIGPLGDGRGGKEDEDAAITAASTFLTRLVAGSIDRQLIAPDSQESISDSLSYGLEQGYTPKSFRLGVPKSREDGEVTAHVRLFGAEGASEGEIYMTHAGRQWLVADMQISLADLTVKRAAPTGKFFPSTYRWLLEE